MSGFGPPVSGGAGAQIKESGVVIGTQRSINLIEGANITITPVDDPANGEIDVTIAATGGGGSLAIEDEGVSQGGATTMDFVGSMVTASVTGSDATVTVAHGNLAGGALHDAATSGTAGFMSAADKTKLDAIAASATNGISTQDEGGAVGSNQTTLNFVGAAVTASSAGSTTTVTISTAVARTVAARTTNLTLVAADTNTTYTNRGATGEVTLTLPAPTSGVYFRGVVLAAQFLRFTATGSAVIWLGSNSSASNGYVRSNVRGSMIEIESDGTDWYIQGPSGTWYLDS